jgi:hypothetical protein
MVKVVVAKLEHVRDFGKYFRDLIVTHRAAVSDHLADFIAEHCVSDFQAIRLTLNQRLGKMFRLFERHLRGHRRLERIHLGLDHDRSGSRERLVKDGSAFRLLFDREAGRAACAREAGEIDRLKIDALFRSTGKHHLLPFYLTERVVFYDHDFYRQSVFDAGGKLRHQHREAAVSYESDALAIRICGLCRDRIRQPASAKSATFASGDAARLLLGSSSYAKMAMGSVAQ